MTNPYNTTGGTYKHIAAGQATTVVKAAPGILVSISYNSASTASNVTTIYDNPSTSGTVIGIAAAPAQGTVYYNCEFLNGLTIITATANGADMTVVFV